MKSVKALIAHALAFLLIAPLESFAQNCYSEIPATTPTANFQINSDGTVVDIKTGLMWKRCPEGLSGNDCSEGEDAGASWDEALLVPGTLNTGGGFAGYSDWRLPNIKELRSIVEEQCRNAAINRTVFPGTLDLIVWSSSPGLYSEGSAWSIYFANGYLRSDPRSGFGASVRLVRNP